MSSCHEGLDFDQLRYSETYDSFYCPTCRAWIEKPCGDEDCHFCVDRPETAPEEDW